MKVNEAKGGDSALGIRKSVTAKELKYTDSFTPPHSPWERGLWYDDTGIVLPSWMSESPVLRGERL